MQRCTQQIMNWQCHCQPVPCCSTSRLPLARQKSLVPHHNTVSSSKVVYINLKSPSNCSSSSLSSSLCQLHSPSVKHRQRRSVVTAAAAAAGDFADSSSSHGSIWDQAPGLLKQVQDFVSAQYLPIALVCALTLGAVNPSLGLAASKMHIPAVATFGIFTVQVRADIAAQYHMFVC